jgi:hypothetical protein
MISQILLVVAAVAAQLTGSNSAPLTSSAPSLDSFQGTAMAVSAANSAMPGTKATGANDQVVIQAAVNAICTAGTCF